MKLPGGDTFLFRGVMLKRSTHELLSQNKSDARRQLLEMAQEDQGDTSQQTTASDEDKGTVNQASPCVIEIHDSTNECEEEPRHSPVQMEEKTFIARLHTFMKAKGTPIERIPHLGFKQINLWMIYKAVEKLGGYDSVTAGRYWKKVYDELGGSPGSTSAATCTRRHYERLVLPYERHIKGEEDKPLPPSKPRKPYKRNLDGKINKAEVKRKRIQSEREMDPEMLTHRSPETDAVMHPHSSRWASSSDRHRPDCAQPSRAPTDLCPSVFAHLVPVPASSSWTAHIPSAAGEVISPLEKKKRMAQASLNLSPQSEDKERPSVIHCPQSPARASSSRNCNSSDGSPRPLSSSSSRSRSSSSISSEDSSTENEEKPTPASEPSHNCSSTAKNTSSRSEDKSASCSQMSKDLAGQNKDDSHISSQTLTADSVKSQTKDHTWKLSHKASSKYSTHPIHVSHAFTEKLAWAPSTSSFTKVIPKSVQLLRPAAVRPDSKPYPDHSRNSVVSLYFPTEKRDKSRTMLQKVPLSQQGLPHASGPSLPVPCVLSSYDKLGRDSRHHPPPHPVYPPSRMRLPPSPLMYRHVPLAPAHPALIGHMYPYHMPLLTPQTGYACSLPAIYPHKM